MTFFDELRWRGLLAEGAEAALANRPQTAEVGFDPTSSRRNAP